MRARGQLRIDSSSALAIGMVCAALLFVLRCVLDLDERRRVPGLPPMRCSVVSASSGQRCTFRVGHAGAHLYSGDVVQCEVTRTIGAGVLGGTRQQRCRLLEHHDGEHAYDDDDESNDERG